jgi:hypothetical protein
MFLYDTCDSQLGFEFDKRNCRDVRACVCVVTDLFEESATTGPGSLGPFLARQAITMIAARAVPSKRPSQASAPRALLND